MIKLQRIGHILINVRDVERSKAFYTDVLGFKVLEQDPGHGGGVFLSLGEYGNTLDIFPSANPDAYPQPKPGVGRREGLGVKHMAFAVENEAELTKAVLRAQGRRRADPSRHRSHESEEHLLLRPRR